MARINKLVWLGFLLTMLFGFSAFWWGESGAGIDVFVNALILGVLLSLTALFIKKPITIKLVCLIGFNLLWVLAFNQGQQSYRLAFNACLSDGELIRQALRHYYQMYHVYPKSLAELAVAGPCKPWLHSSLLHYKTTEQGYTLAYSDSFVLHQASESELFNAHK